MQIKKILGFLVLILTIMLNCTLAFSEKDINSYQYLKLEINNNIGFDFGSSILPNIHKVDLTSYFFPQTIIKGQYLNSFNSNFEYEILNNSDIYSLKYQLMNSDLKTVNQIENKFIVESTVTRPEVKTEIKYPIINLSDKDKTYLTFYDLIDTNDEIKIQASKLAQGESDAFIVASKVAKWLQSDINYDLSTITQLPNQKASEVFQSKRGVCKEGSNLFISMMRSLGIPARVVTGYA